MNWLDQTLLLKIGLAVLICYLICRYLLVKNNQIKADPQNYSPDWINTGYGYGYGQMNPADRLSDLIKEFGQPRIYDSNKGGGAIWTKEQLTNTPYERIEIKDEQIPHDIPKPHTDFLYSWYRIDIPEHLIGGLHKISSSISYDPLKKLMRARCHDMRPNVVTHWIVKNYAKGKLTIDEAVGMYGPMILELFLDDPGDQKYRQLESDL